MKRLLYLLFPLLLLLVLTACAGKPEIGEGELEYTESKDYYTVKGIGTYTGTVVEIPSEYKGKTVRAIGTGAFKDTDITKVILPSSIAIINSSAFENCTSLTEVVSYSAKIGTVSRDAFKNTPFLDDGIEREKVFYLGNVLLGVHPDYEGELRLKEGTYATAYDAMAGCSRLTSLVVPEGMYHFGKYALMDCVSLESVTFDGAIGYIGEGVFYGCTSLKGIALKGSCVSIGPRAFAYCESLASVTLGEKTDILDKSAFAYCSSLERITLPETMKTLADEAFLYCTSLREINFPEALASVGHKCFKGCKSLTVPTLGEGVTVGVLAFDGCKTTK